MTGIVDFACWQIDSGDNDPAYPVLGAVLDALGIHRLSVEAERFVLLYVAFYSLPSALVAWLALDGWDGRQLDDRLAKLPTGIERRGLRTAEKMNRHLASVAGFHEARWLPRPADTLNPKGEWRRVFADLQAPEFNGRWAAYKTGEILQKVLGWPIEPTDAGHEHSSGPLAGLRLLDPTLTDAPVPVLDAATERLRLQVEEAHGDPVDVAEVETVLCDWHSLVEGRYYVGHDIDLMQSGVASTPLRGEPEGRKMADLITEARHSSFDHRWLGEVQGWPGMRPPLKRLFADEGRLDWW